MADQQPPTESLDLLEDEMDEEQEVNNVSEKTRVRIAMDSGAARHTINKDDLPKGSVITPNTSGKHFVGPGGEHIQKYGSCKVIMDGECGKAGCEWQAADVTRALHSVSTTTGPPTGPGNYDVLFNNRLGVVVPAGWVDKVLQHAKPLAKYHREGGLYIADMELSGFTRPGAGK